MAHQTHNKSGNHGIRSPLRVTVVTNQCVHCGSTFADRSTVQNHVVNSWTRGTCRTDRSRMTWALEEITQPICCNLCAQEFGDLQTYYAHVRLIHLPFLSPTIQEKPARQPRRHRQHSRDLDMSGSLGSIKRDGSRGGEEPRRQLRRTVSRTKQRGGGGQRLDDSGTQAQGRRQGRAEESQQDHAQGHPQDASDDARPILDGVLIKASSPEADNMQKQTQNTRRKGAARGARTHTKPTLRMGISGPGQVSQAEGATQ